MKKIGVSILLLLVLMASSFNIIYAASDFGDWWDKANTWYENGSTNVSVDQSALTGISNLIEIVGTGVIAIVTVVLGMKYMLGSATGKSEVKENLVGLIVACTFFFGWSSIRDLLIVGNATGNGGMTGATHLVFLSGENISTTFSQIFTFLVIVAKLVCVAVIAYNGVKYIFAGADAKAQLKQKMPMMLIGVVLVFCTITFLEFVSTAIQQAL